MEDMEEGKENRVKGAEWKVRREKEWSARRYGKVVEGRNRGREESEDVREER